MLGPRRRYTRLDIEQPSQLGEPRYDQRHGGHHNTATAARYAAAASTGLLPRADSRRTRSTVLGPTAASAPRRPAGRAGDQRPGQGSAAGGAYGGVVREQLDEQLHRAQRVGAADESRESGVRRGERFQNQVVAGAQWARRG